MMMVMMQMQISPFTGVPGENQHQTQATGNFPTCLGGDSGSGERQVAVSGNALDHSTIRAGPQW